MTARTDETTATGNEAALRFRLRAAGIADLTDHAALRRFAANEPAAFAAAVRAFAGIAGSEAWLAPALTAVLLEADLRPDDRLLVAGTGPWPWVVARTQGIPVILAEDVTAETLRARAEAEGASVVAAPPAWLLAAGLLAAGLGAEPEAGLRGVWLDGWSGVVPA